MQDILHWVNRRNPVPLFFTFRLYSAWVTVLFGFLWLLYGYDSTTGSIRMGIQGIGIHLSTIQLIVFTFYVLLLNLQVGGLTSLRQLATCFWEDLTNAKWFFKGSKEERKAYIAAQPEAVNGVSAFMFAFFAVLGALFLFEVPYVLLHDYFNYGGDPMWPIYAFIGPQEISIVARNFGFMFLTVLPPLVLAHGVPQTRRTYRIDKKWGVMVVACLGVWALWVFYPFPHATGHYTVWDNQTVSAFVDGELYGNRVFDREVTDITWPLQERFPQNVYTYYIVGFQEDYAGRDDMGEFYVPDVGIRTVNLILKYLVFLVVVYPLMVRVEKR